MHMRRSEAALAVIRRPFEGGSRWLAIWNVKWDAFHFVGGHRRPDEAFNDCLVREIFEELALRDGIDCHVEPTPMAHLVYTAWSNHARADTDYSMELFDVTLEEQAEPSLRANPAVRWLTDDEIRFERCRDGRPVSPTMGFLIAKAGLA
jgi:8-oxo-dGTP pyrophosphatase MutT (NUDIX family)